MFVRAPAVLALTLLLLLLHPFSPHEPALASERLDIASTVTYEIAPAEGPIRVTWQVVLDNNDPTTVRDAADPTFYYESLTVPVLRGATNLSGTGPTGGELLVDIELSEEGPIDVATVVFDEPLFYADTYTFHLSYDILEARSTALLATDSYVFLPAIASGDSADVRIITTNDPDWDVTIEAIDCPQVAGGAYSCGPSEYVQVAAFVEVAHAGVLASSNFTVPLQSTEMSISLHHFPGEEAWASHITALTQAALPVLEELFGFAYTGPAVLEIAERGRQDLSGYEGIFGCAIDHCFIGMSPLAGDHVAIHELAHLWTPAFEARWIAEGLAEFMAERAAAQLGGLVEQGEPLAPSQTVDLHLHDWGRTNVLIGATDDQLAIEEAGYYRSRVFFEAVENAIGLRAIQDANAAADQLGSGVGSERYFDLLEEASGMRLDELFLGEVFPPSYAPRLEQRHALRERLDALRPQARDAGFSLPARIGQLLAEWQFAEAERLLSAAERALDVYLEARERVREPRDLWTRIGLFGKNPDETLGEAADAFAASEFARSERLSRAAVAEIDGASDAALTRVLIGSGGLAVILAVAVASLWLVRSRASYRAP